MHPKIPLLHDITLPDIISGLEQGLFTSAALVTAYLARIKEVDHHYRSVIETNPDAPTIAEALDNELKQLIRRGPLHGVPILLKDNIPTFDTLETTCGSLALVGARPNNEAAVATTLRRAGAVILGKANMAEWSGFRSTTGCSGWSSRGGQTQGIFYPGMKASGSSGGCAVATALGLCFAAVGTETCYSIVSPAERSGIIGFKPTRNLISVHGIIHASQRQDTVGLLTRTVSDAMLILTSIILESDTHSQEVKLKLTQELSTTCSNIDLSAIRIGVPDDLEDMRKLHPAKMEAFKKVLHLLEHTGATVVRSVCAPGVRCYESLSKAEKEVVLDTDMKVAINKYLSSLVTNPHNIRNLQDLIEFTKSRPEEEYPQRNVEGLERANVTDPKAELYADMVAKDAYFANEGGISGMLGQCRCDVLLIPTLSVTLQTFAAKAGSPVMSVPMGSYPEGTIVEEDVRNGLIDVAPGIPFSTFIFGRATKDETVLKVGYSLEQLTRVRENLRPYFRPTTEIYRGERGV